MGTRPTPIIDWSKYETPPLPSGYTLDATPRIDWTKYENLPPLPAGYTLDQVAPTQEQKLSRTLQNMTYVMSGQSDQMHPDDKAEFDRGVAAGATSAALTTATGAARGALAALTAPTVTGTEAVGTGILDATSKEIMRDVTTYGPSVARLALSHPLTQSLLARAVGYAGAGYILKVLRVFDK